MAEQKKVFIFDDNTDILELCTFILEDAGYEIKTSSTSNNIIDQVMAYIPDIIFMDNWLPDVGGIDATRALKSDEKLKNIPVIYFSANNDVMSLAEQAGADGYLSKPFDIQELENIILKHLPA
ncbi:two-component system cell cycle response regulator DivK [Pedobacter cryoconitis]|jgi:CheY-like chemotaxis protein|uniref:Two-component system cell cycle response regulator DivK n=1 Tax=Pedobacter cryoconitis TaxID=188932 RepID=A0A7W9DY12_9SPHI|nr:response regulator [Pedobacter cryoconitis]MBB5635436.1 two-component system cell cycle response regulator DivK [Pedobacter cryoconitis]MBB6273702.1 two-component system cell cycle response regulator DivK [Pedobacter cryoconitis]